MLTVTVTPPGLGGSRTYQIPGRWYRLLRVGAFAFGALLLFGVTSWVWLAVRSLRVAELEDRQELLEAERAVAVVLAGRVQELEERYERLRSLYTHIDGEESSPVWLPLAGGVDGDTSRESRLSTAQPPPEETAGESGPYLPSAWPLTQRGFVTRRADPDEADHPGVDIAIATDSYVRASGGGTVSDVGEDEAYGKFVVIEHSEGYSTRYAHASVTFVSEGQEVQPREVIALSGSTGQSTAPHLHFEVLHNGVPVDPLEFVTQPR